MRHADGRLFMGDDKKTEIWVNLQQVVQITAITVQDGYPSTELILTSRTQPAPSKHDSDAKQEAGSVKSRDKSSRK